MKRKFIILIILIISVVTGVVFVSRDSKIFNSAFTNALHNMINKFNTALARPGNSGYLDRQAYMSEILRITGEQPNTALQFDGENDYINCGSDTSLKSASFSVELWFKKEENKIQGLVIKTGEGNYWRLFNTSPGAFSRIQFDARHGAEAEIGNINTPSTIVIGEWNHVTATYDSPTQTAKIYLNGVFSEQATSVDYQNNYIQTFYMGCLSPSSYLFNGTIDEVRIYNRALSAAEVRDRYNGIEVPTNDADTTTSNGESAGTPVVIEVAATTGFSIGDKIQISSTSTETTTITAVDDGVSISANLVNDYYGAGATVERSDLVLNMGLDEGTGTTPADSSVYENNGSFGGAPTWIDYSAPVSSFSKMPVLWIAPQYGYESAAKYFDLSGNENHATQGTGANQPKFRPPGLVFDGTDDYLDCGNDASLNITDAITIEAWVKLQELNRRQAIVNSENSNVMVRTQYGVHFRDSNRFYFNRGDETHSQHIYSPVYTELKWYHIVCVDTTSKMIIYVNGENVVEDDRDYTPTSNIDSIFIGSRGVTHDFFNSAIDEVRIYNRALSANQINALYLAGLPRHQ